MRSNASLEAGIAILAACTMEAAGITLAYLALGSLATHQQPPLPMLAFVGAAAAGLGYARWSVHAGRHYRTPLAALVIGAAIVGWLLPLGAAAVRLTDDPWAVIGAHPGGILLGLAVFRGSAHVTSEDDARIAETVLGPGLWAIAGTWAFLAATGATGDPAIVSAAFSATVAVVTAALLGMGLARLGELEETGMPQGDQRTWVALLVAVIACLLVVSVPLAAVLGIPSTDALRGVLGPIADVIVVIITILAIPGGLLAAALVFLLELVRGPLTGSTDLGGTLAPGPLEPGNPAGATGIQAVALGLAPLAIAIIVAFLVIRALLNRPRLSAVESDLVETRETEGPAGGIRFRRPRVTIPRRRPDPRTASEAYMASLEVLSRVPNAARLPSETPSEHADRTRSGSSGSGDPLGRLAADYALAEFGHRELTRAEHRRAIERWRRLRSMPRD